MSSQLKHSCFAWWLFYGFTLLLTLKTSYLKNDSVNRHGKEIAYAKSFCFMSDFLLAL